MSGAAKALLVVLGIAVAAVVVDRVLLWMESRGWLHWRKTKTPPSGSLSSTALEMQAFVDPKVRYVIEERVNEVRRSEEDDAGEPPEPSAKRS